MNGFLKSKRFAGVLIFLSIVLLLAACGSNNNADKNGNASGNNSGNVEEKISGTITIAGSTSVQPIAEELAYAFMEKHKDARIEVSGGGSGAGVSAAQTGTADIGMASRAIRDDETGIEPIVIAIDGIAVVTHPNNEVKDLTLEQVQGIFAGEIKNWSEVGGADEDIVVVIREEGSGTRDAFAEIVLGDKDFFAEAIIQNSTGAVREAVSQDPKAIGFVSVGGLNDSVTAVKVDGAEPTEANIQDESYPIARPFNFLVGEDGPNELAQAFIDFILSSEGQAIVSNEDFVPVK